MSRRIDRVNELLRQEISRLLTLQIKDPRLKGVITITRVTTSSDLRVAQVFLSVMGDSEVKRSALEGIRSAATFLRRELRPRVSLRYTPFLTFDLDESLEEADHILDIMDSIRDDQASDNQATGDQATGNQASGDQASGDQATTEEEDRYIGPITFPPSGG